VLTIDELAPAHRVHRATIARWLDSARKQVLSATRSMLVSRHSLDPAEADSILRAVRSQIDLSLTRLLAARADER
jgi:hypothetical protein